MGNDLYCNNFIGVVCVGNHCSCMVTCPLIWRYGVMEALGMVFGLALILLALFAGIAFICYVLNS